SAWADQTASVPRVVMLAVIRSQFVAMRRRVQMPEVDVQSMLHQHVGPIVNEVCPNLPTCLALPAGVLPPRRWFFLGAKLLWSLSRSRKQKVVPSAQTTF